MTWWRKRIPVQESKRLRGDRWQQFYTEEGGAGDIIQSLRQAYFEKASALKPNDIEGYKALSQADRILREIDASIIAIIDSGEIERNAEDHASRVAKLPARLRGII